VVEVQGELWTATSADTLKIGDKVKITAMDGLTLVVKPKETDTTKTD
jgi:membrane protein implicated in regulation of membrane protease activity